MESIRVGIVLWIPYVIPFYGLYGDLARRFKLPSVPFLLANVAPDEALFQEDGIHPTAAAQPRLLEEVWPHLQPMLARK